VLRDRPPLLVVDDDEVNRIIASGLAQSLGYRVDSAADGIEALAACKASPPAVVLMDLTMPRLGGIDATLLLRDLQRAGEVPPFAIIAVTADSGAQTCERCLEAGMDGCLTKPLLRSALQDELRRLRTGLDYSA
jgi:CheY-like chemotaxis protein